MLERRITGNDVEGWNITPGLEIHPITIIGPKSTIDAVVKLIETADHNYEEALKKITLLFSSENLRWIELEKFLEQNQKYHKSGKEIPLGIYCDDVDDLYDGKLQTISKLLLSYYNDIASGIVALKAINDLRIEVQGEARKWKCVVDGVGDSARCKKCRSISNKSYRLDQTPLPPFHFGCRCTIRAELKLSQN
jgi:hypothetical protein